MRDAEEIITTINSSLLDLKNFLLEKWAVFKKNAIFAVGFRYCRSFTSHSAKSCGEQLTKPRKGILPKVLNFEIAKTVENKRTLDEECPSSVSYMPGLWPHIYRYGRGVNFFNTRNTALGIGILCVLAAPFTGGGSLLGLGATAGAIALSESVIIAIIGAVVSISVAAINAVKEYKIRKLDANRIEFTRK